MEQEDQICLPADLIGIISNLLAWREANKLRLCAKWISTELILRHCTACDINPDDPTSQQLLQTITASGQQHMRALSTLCIRLQQTVSQEKNELFQDAFKVVQDQIREFYVQRLIPNASSWTCTNVFLANHSILEVLHIDEPVYFTWATELFSPITRPNWPALRVLHLRVHVNPRLLELIAESCSNLEQLCLFAPFEFVSSLGERHLGALCSSLRSVSQANPRLRRFQIDSLTMVNGDMSEDVATRSFTFLAGKEDIFKSHADWSRLSELVLKNTGLPLSALIVEGFPAWICAYMEMCKWPQPPSPEALEALVGLLRQCHPSNDCGEKVMWSLYCSYESRVHPEKDTKMETRLALALWTLQRIEELLDLGEHWLYCRGFYRDGRLDGLSVLARAICEFMIVSNQDQEHLNVGLNVLKRLILLDERPELELCVDGMMYIVHEPDEPAVARIINTLQSDSDFMVAFANKKTCIAEQSPAETQ